MYIPDKFTEKLKNSKILTNPRMTMAVNVVYLLKFLGIICTK